MEDVAYVNDFGGVIKLLGKARRENGGKISAMVCPCIVKNHSQLASVSDVFNAILVRGDAIGDVVFTAEAQVNCPQPAPLLPT